MYYIMTKMGMRPTSKRKALLHAASTADRFSEVGSTVVGPPDKEFRASAQDLYMRTTSRGNWFVPLTDKQAEVYLQSRLSARKLKVGIEAINRKYERRSSPAARTTYKIIDTLKSSWLIEGVRLIRQDETYKYSKIKYLIGKSQGGSVWVYRVPANIKTCRGALNYCREAMFGIPNRRSGTDRRKSGGRLS